MYLKSYKELHVWQKSVLLVKEIYVLTSQFPSTEIYGLTSQLKRAAVSIPSNLAEGYGRRSQKEFRHHCAIAYGSALELETQIIIAKELKFIDIRNYKNVDVLLEEVLKMLNAMHSKLSSR